MVNRRKRARGTPPFANARDQRRKLDEFDMYVAMADTSPGPGIQDPHMFNAPNPFATSAHPHTDGGRMGPSLRNPFEMALQSASAFPSPSPITTRNRRSSVRSPPSPHLNDSDYLNPDDLPPAGSVSASAGPAGAPPTENMAADPATRAVQPLAEPNATPAARGFGLAPTTNIPLREFGASGTLAYQFNVQTPRQENDAFNPASIRPPQQQTLQPPFAGPYILRDAPVRRPPQGSQTDPRAGMSARDGPPLRCLDVGAGREDRRIHPERDSMDTDRMNDEESLNGDQENRLPPGARGFSRHGSHFDEQADVDFSRLAAHHTNLIANAPYQSTPSPLPLNPLTGRVSKVGQRQQSGPIRYREPAIPPCILHPRMPVPVGGYPRIRFQDPDSLTVGTDEAILADMRDIKKSGTVLGVRVARVNGVPPDKHARNICGWIEAITTDITGESRVSCVPPRPASVRRQGEPGPFVWFLCDLTEEGATVMLDVGVVSCPTISFFVFPLTVPADLVIVLTGFVNTAGFQIEAMIRNIFEGPAMRAIIDQFVPANPLFRETPTDLATQFVLETLEIELDTLGGSIPCAKVYIASPSGTTDGWRRFREAVARVPFEDRYNPRASIRTLSCEICSGNDHTMQTCRFPTLPGWKGPVPAPEQIQDEPALMGSELVFAPRAGGGANNLKKQGGAGKSGGYYSQQSGPPFGGQNFGGGRGGGGAGGAGGYGQGMRAF